MADFIDFEESLYLIPPSVSPNPRTPVPSQPFPFLKLPREIRDSIYYYALLRSRNGNTAVTTHICYFHSQSTYWGTKESTRLFLVNRQFSSEALELFYSTYPFHFPEFIDVAVVNAALRDTLSPWARSLIAKIGFKFGFFSTPGRFALRDEEKAGQVIQTVMDLLPNVKQVVLTLTIDGFDVPEYQAKENLDRVLRIASPLKGFAGLSVDGSDHETAQRTRTMREVREALGCQ